MTRRVFGKRLIGRKQRQLGMAMRPFVKGFDLPTPSCMLAVVDLAEIQHLTLHHLAAGTPLVFNDIPIAMLFRRNPMGRGFSRRQRSGAPSHYLPKNWDS